MIDQGEKTQVHKFAAYKFDIYATSPVSRGLYIDATTGAALYYNATIKPR
jgi:hypothetical protein